METEKKGDCGSVGWPSRYMGDGAPQAPDADRREAVNESGIRDPKFVIVYRVIVFHGDPNCQRLMLVASSHYNVHSP